MKIKSSTLQLLGRVAALSAVGTTASLADKPAPNPPRLKTEIASPDMRKIEARVAFALLDANKDGKITPEEFGKRHHHLVAVVRSKQARAHEPRQPHAIQPVICEACGRG